MSAVQLLPHPLGPSVLSRVQTAVARRALSTILSVLRFLFTVAPSLVTPASLKSAWEGLSARTKAFLLLVKLTKPKPSTDVNAIRKRTEGIVHLVYTDRKYKVEQVNANGVPTEIVTADFRGPSAPGGAILWLHGGGYMAGRAHQYRGPAAELSARMGAIPVIIPDYRLVPEADFATEVVGDCVEAYKWAVERYQNLIIIGDSAGGGLVFHTTSRLQDLSLPLPTGLIALSPFLDLTNSLPSLTTHANVDVMVDRPSVEFICNLFSASPTPIQKASLKNVPPALVLVGDHEVLLDDAKNIAREIESEGGEVQLVAQKGMCHVYPAFFKWMDEADAGMDLIANWARAKLGWRN